MVKASAGLSDSLTWGHCHHFTVMFQQSFQPPMSHWAELPPIVLLVANRASPYLKTDSKICNRGRVRDQTRPMCIQWRLCVITSLADWFWCELCVSEMAVCLTPCDELACHPDFALSRLGLQKTLVTPSSAASRYRKWVDGFQWWVLMQVIGCSWLLFGSLLI